MGDIKPNQKLYDVVKDIRDGHYLLPSIQRSFVWEQEKICKLMDSLMSDYPIGSLLVWKPPSNMEIRTKEFVKDYRSGMRTISADRPLKQSPYLVLDGQQRLQSLYLSFFGRFDTKYMYFKIDSDPTQEQDGLKYQFQFLTTDEAKLSPKWVFLRDLTDIEIPKIKAFVDRGFKDESDGTKERIAENLGKFIEIFKIQERIALQSVKETLPYNDVLEIFVRVNSGGTVLTKSDLVFSTIVLSTPRMEREFIELVDQLNGNGEYDFDTDFLIKTSFVLFDKAAKYDVDKLKDANYLRRLDAEFDGLQTALFAAKEFLKSDAKLLSKRFLKSDLALVPIVDFIFRQPHRQIPEGQAKHLRQYLYMSFLMRFYSYGPDAKLDVIHGLIKNAGKVFPLGEIGKYMEERTGIKYTFAPGASVTDLDLLLNIMSDGVAEIPKLRGWSLERDHIFPQSILRDKGFADDLIDCIGNLRLINKTRNILKSAQIPAEDLEFFGSNDPQLRELFLKTRKELTEGNFTNFVARRDQLICEKARKFLGFA